MRIAIFTETFLPKIDGITNRLSRTIPEFIRRGHEVLVFGPENSVRSHAGAEVVRIPGLPFPPYPELRVALPDPRIAWHLMRFRPDVVHVVGPAALGTWGAITAAALGYPLVASYHTDLPRYAELHGMGFAKDIIWPSLRAVHNLAELTLSPSRYTRLEMEDNGIRNVGLWRGGVDTELFNPSKRCAAMRSRLSAGDVDAPLMVTACRVSPEKGLDTLREVLEARPDVRLAIVGDGPARADLEKHYAGLPVVFTGFLRGEALAAAFASGDLFVVPSTTETLGFVVMEAMASGMPVIAANAGGIPDMIRNGEDGILYRPGVPGVLPQIVSGLLEQPGQARHLAEQARKSAERSSWSSETRELIWTYKRAIEAYTNARVYRRVRHALGF